MDSFLDQRSLLSHFLYVFNQVCPTFELMSSAQSIPVYTATVNRESHANAYHNFHNAVYRCMFI